MQAVPIMNYTTLSHRQRIGHHDPGVASVVGDDGQCRRVNQEAAPREQGARRQLGHRAHGVLLDGEVDERLGGVDAAVVLGDSALHQRHERHSVLKDRRHEQKVIHLYSSSGKIRIPEVAEL